MKFNEKDVMKLRKEMIIEKDDFLEKKTEKFYNKTPENLLFTNKKACLQVSAYEWIKKILRKKNNSEKQKIC